MAAAIRCTHMIDCAEAVQPYAAEYHSIAVRMLTLAGKSMHP